MQIAGRSKAPEANFGETVASERKISGSLDGGTVALDQQNQGVRLNNFRFSSFCIRRHRRNSHPKNGQVSARHL